MFLLPCAFKVLGLQLEFSPVMMLAALMVLSLAVSLAFRRKPKV
jgi:hypothetical protein